VALKSLICCLKTELIASGGLQAQNLMKSPTNDLCICFLCVPLLLLVVSSANLLVHDKFDGKILACVEFYGNLISNSRTSRFW
jgi:hypothetical protein